MSDFFLDSCYTSGKETKMKKHTSVKTNSSVEELGGMQNLELASFAAEGWMRQLPEVPSTLIFYDCIHTE